MTRKSNVFVIDDDKIFHFIIRKLLARRKIEVDLSFFENGLDALNYIKDNSNCPASLPDLILLDINMPILDGWQFLDEYSQLTGTLPHEPKIYLISSSDSAVDTEKAREFEHIVTKYMLKPMDNEGIDAIFTSQVDANKKSLSH